MQKLTATLYGSCKPYYPPIGDGKVQCSFMDSHVQCSWFMELAEAKAYLNELQNAVWEAEAKEPT